MTSLPQDLEPGISVLPTISVIIPCRNEALFMDRCLKSVFDSDGVPGGMEVIVVDGMSDDGTRDILAQWASQHPGVKILDNPKRIVPAAMNIGIRAAQGSVIVRLDAHAAYPKSYLRLCWQTIQHTQADNVGGVVVTLPRGGALQALLVQAVSTHRFGVGNSNFRLNAAEGLVDTVPFGCFQRKVFETIGLYDERLVRNQDYELNRRLTRAGGRIWLNPKIQAYYYNQSSIRGLARQAFVTGQWNAWMWYIAPYTFALRHIIPACFVLTLVSIIALSFWFAWSPFLFWLILLLYFVLDLIASIQQSRLITWKLMPILPLVFPFYHFAYGTGTLWGLIKLLARNTPVQ